MTSSFIVNTVGHQGLESVKTAALAGKGQDKIGSALERLWDRISDWFTGGNSTAAKQNLYTLFSTEATDAQKYDAFLQLKDLAKSGYEQDFEIHANTHDDGATLKINLGFSDIQEFHLGKLPSVDYLTIATLGFNQNFESAKKHMVDFLSPTSSPLEKFNAFESLKKLSDDSQQANFKTYQSSTPDMVTFSLTSGNEDLYKITCSRNEILTKTSELQLNESFLIAQIKDHISASGKEDIIKMRAQADKDIARNGVYVNGSKEPMKSMEEIKYFFNSGDDANLGLDDFELDLIRKICVQTVDGIICAEGVDNIKINVLNSPEAKYSFSKSNESLTFTISNEWNALPTTKSGDPINDTIDALNGYINMVMASAPTDGDHARESLISPIGKYSVKIEFQSSQDPNPKISASLELSEYIGPVELEEDNILVQQWVDINPSNKG